MVNLLKRLILYAVLRLAGSITSLFKSRREVMVALLLVLLVGGWLYIQQDTKNTRLLQQAGTGDEETITQTVQDGAWIMATDEFGRSALHIAARYSNVATVTALLELGAAVDARDFRGRTPLHMTRYDGGANTEIVRLLLKHGADPQAQDYKGRTPLEILKGQSRYNKPAEDLLLDALHKKQAEAEAEAHAGKPRFLQASPEPATLGQE